MERSRRVLWYREPTAADWRKSTPSLQKATARYRQFSLRSPVPRSPQVQIFITTKYREHKVYRVNKEVKGRGLPEKRTGLSPSQLFSGVNSRLICKKAKLGKLVKDRLCFSTLIEVFSHIYKLSCSNFEYY